MKRLALVALIIAMAMPSHAAITAKMTRDKSGNLVFTCYGEEGTGMRLQLSKYPDFSRVLNGPSFTTDKTNKRLHSLTVKPSQLAAGTYYWYIINLNTNSYSPSKDKWTTFEFGTGKEDIPDLALKDTTPHATFSPDTDTDINISSLWLRSFNLGNNIFRSIDHPNVRDEAKFETSNHGAVVRDGIIYINRGSANTAGWMLNKTRVWLERYDLATGTEYPLLIVRAPGGGDYPTEEVMPWIREDADGTIYFTTSRIATGAQRRVTLYTIDLDGVTADTEDITATEVKTIALPEGFDSGAFFTVDGSIASKRYTLWAMPETHYVYTLGKEFTVHRWSINGSSVKHCKATMPPVKWLTPDLRVNNGFGMPRIYPVDNEYFYTHTGRGAKPDATMSVMLCRFVDGGECEIISSLDDSTAPVPAIAHGSAGLSLFEIEGHKMIAYAIAKETNNTVMQIVSTPSYTANFREHSLVWRLCDDKGMSANAFQGCDVKYLPAKGNEGDRLLLYAPNAALGLYKVDIDTKATAIDSPRTDTNGLSYRAGCIITDTPVDGISLYDTSGRLVASRTSRGTSFDITGTAPGLYIVKIKGTDRSVKIAVTP